MVKDRAQGAEQETVGMAVEPDHPGESHPAEIQPSAQWTGAAGAGGERGPADDKYQLI